MSTIKLEENNRRIFAFFEKIWVKLELWELLQRIKAFSMLKEIIQLYKVSILRYNVTYCSIEVDANLCGIDDIKNV